MIDSVVPEKPMPGRTSSAKRPLAALLCAMLVSLAHIPPANADCQPDPAAAASEEPYTGYTPTGYKGAMERDAVWHRAVRARAEADGRQVYQLRAKKAAGKAVGSWYDSIEPVDLGARRPGFVVRRNGCAHLLDAAGRQLDIPAFSQTEGAYGYIPAGKRLFKLVTNSPNGTTYRYALFAGGRLKAVSPHEYLTSYYGSSLPATYLPKNLVGIAVSEQNGHGLIDLDSLDEVIQPVWRGVGGLGLANEGGAGRYLLADDGKTRTLFSADGRQQLLANIEKITLIPDWFPYRKDQESAERAIIAITENGGQTCRLFDIKLNLLLPLTLRTERGECPTWRGGQPAKYYVGETFDNVIHVYTLEAPARLQAQGMIAGRMATATTKGVVLARIDTPEGERYRAFAPDGTRANAQDFDEYRHLGCGFLEVRVGKKWLTLYHDGSTTEKRFYPFSC
jgi:hypothetical protein